MLPFFFPPDFTVLTALGQPQLEHPLERCDGLTGSDSSLVAYQYWLDDGTSRHRDPDHRRDDVFVYHHDFLSAPQAYQRGASPTAPMDPRSLRYGHQHRGTVLPAPSLCVRLLPAHFDGGA